MLAFAAGRWRLALVWFVLLVAAAPVRGQSSFEREVLYTRAAGSATVRRALVTYEATPIPTLTVAAPTDVASPAGADGICVAPGGDLLVAGGATAANAVHRVQLATGQIQTASPGLGNPIATQVALDPAGDRLWSVCTVAGAGRISRVNLSTFGPGVASAITGPDTVVASICFAHGRAYYVATGTGGNAGSLGVIDLNTFVTTRLLTGLDRPKSVMLDPYTGHLVVFCSTSILQVDARPGVPAAVISSADLMGLVPWLMLRSGTVDGSGHALALSTTGHLVLVDYSATREIGHATNPRAATMLEAAGMLGSIVPLVGPGGFLESSCLWDNGDFDTRDGLPSHNSWSLGDTRTADDFYLCSGIHRLDAISATMFSDSLFLTAQIELYEDCNGTPGALVGTFSASVKNTGTVFQGLRVLDVEAPTTGLWLRGGRAYWVSAVGIGSLDGTDNWYWGTSGAPPTGAPPGTPNTIRGKPGVFRAPSQGVPEWTTTQQAGCGCTDFAFKVRGESCKVLHDNGPPQEAADPAITGAPSIISTTNSDSRAADNFRVPPSPQCEAGEQVCFVEATIYTNCNPVRGLFEVLVNDCALPHEAPLYSAPFSKVIDRGYNVVINGSTLRAYTVQVHDPGWFLPAGRNYWLSVSVQGSGSFNQRAYFAANSAGCDEPECTIHITQSAVRGPAIPSTGWTLVENYLQEPRDLSFVIALVDDDMPHGGTTPLPSDTCLADAEHDGDVDVADIFSFLSHWFQGCP